MEEAFPYMISDKDGRNLDLIDLRGKIRSGKLIIHCFQCRDRFIGWKNNDQTGCSMRLRANGFLQRLLIVFLRKKIPTVLFRLYRVPCSMQRQFFLGPRYSNNRHSLALVPLSRNLRKQGWP